MRLIGIVLTVLLAGLTIGYAMRSANLGAGHEHIYVFMQDGHVLCAADSEEIRDSYLQQYDDRDVECVEVILARE